MLYRFFNIAIPPPKVDINIDTASTELGIKDQCSQKDESQLLTIKINRALIECVIYISLLIKKLRIIHNI